MKLTNIPFHCDIRFSIFYTFLPFLDLSLVLGYYTIKLTQGQRVGRENREVGRVEPYAHKPESMKSYKKNQGGEGCPEGRKERALSVILQTVWEMRKLVS